MNAWPKAVKVKTARLHETARIPARERQSTDRSTLASAMMIVVVMSRYDRL
jgi:hypothetical protein